MRKTITLTGGQQVEIDSFDNTVGGKLEAIERVFADYAELNLMEMDADDFRRLARLDEIRQAIHLNIYGTDTPEWDSVSHEARLAMVKASNELEWNTEVAGTLGLTAAHMELLQQCIDDIDEETADIELNG